MPKQTLGQKAFARIFACVLLLICFALELSLRASAQDIDPRITFLLGGSIPSGSRTFVVGPHVFDSQFQNGVKLGLRATFNVREHWGVEGTYSLSDDGLQITQVAPPVIQSFGVHLDEFTANGHFFFTRPDRNIRPFLTGGFGVSRFSPTADAKLTAAQDFLGQPAVITSSSEFNFNFGAGIEARFREHFGLRLDLRDHLTGIPRFGLPQSATSPSAPFFPISGRLQDVELTAGFVYHFAGR